MNDTPLQSTLRQMRALFTDPVALAIMGGVGLVAGITGPFTTFEHIAPAPRIAYWLMVVFFSYGAGAVGSYLAERLVLRGKPKPFVIRVAILGLAASAPATAAVVAVSSLFLPDLRETGLSLFELYIYCLTISLALLAVLEGVETSRGRQGAAKIATQPPKLLDRLPSDKRGRLTHLSMADHYVEVFTDRGKAMVLMRLADAIAETEGVEGLRIHRSHWVACEAVAGTGRTDGRVVVELKSGETLPVSRSYIAAVRAAFDRQS